ncbi:MAG TPA: 50S ribosomal protein L35 [Magnetospirillaceae bacterium]|nr:50S ribosomal protein L35 [Magnetospirillaceae bacterium]
MAKLKLKTHKGTAKRVRITRTGKVLRGRAFGTHFLEKKSEGRKRVIAKKALIKGKMIKRIKRALGV